MNRIKKISILLGILFLTCFSVSVYAQVLSTDSVQSVVKDFLTKIESDVREDGLNGSISIAVMNQNQIIYSNAFGYVSATRIAKADTNTIYRIGSISKVFTAALMMKLVEENVIKLEDPIEKYLPEVKKINGYERYPQITFRQLASHTSGLQREPHLTDASIGPVGKWEPKVLQCIPNTFFDTLPASKFFHSNIGYAILGLALSRAAGEPFIDLMTKKIFEPLHMRSTYYEVPKAEMKRLAHGIDNAKAGNLDTETPDSEIRGRGYRVPNGGIFSTPNDLAKFFMAMLQSSPILRPESWAEMRTAQVPAAKYGFGIELHKGKDANIMTHGGYVSGYLSEFAIVNGAREQFAVILLRNYSKGKTNLRANAISLVKKLSKEY